MKRNNDVKKNEIDSTKLIGNLFGLITEDDNFVKFMALNDDIFETIQKDVLQSVYETVSDKAMILGLMQEVPELATVSRTELEVSKNELTNAIKEMEISDIKKQFLIDVIGLTYQSLLVAIYNFQRDKDSAPLTVHIEKVDEDAKLPTYAHYGDAGMDVYANEDYTINPGETALIKTGIKVAIPVGYELQVRPRSGLSAKTKLRVANAPGTIDSGFRGEVCVIVENTDSPIKDIVWNKETQNLLVEKGKPYTIEKGDRIAQLVLAKYVFASFSEVSDVSIIGEDRKGGFGSTGK